MQLPKHLDHHTHHPTIGYDCYRLCQHHPDFEVDNVHFMHRYPDLLHVAIIAIGRGCYRLAPLLLLVDDALLDLSVT